MLRRIAVSLGAGLLAAGGLVAAQPGAQAAPVLRPVTHADVHEKTFAIKLSWQRPNDSRVKDITLRRVQGRHWDGPASPHWGFPVTPLTARHTRHCVGDTRTRTQ